LYGDERDAAIAYNGAEDELALDVGGWMHDLGTHVSESLATSGDWQVSDVVAARPVTRTADLFIETGEGITRVAARLDVTSSGARLRPRRDVQPGSRAWLRVGSPGTSPPVLVRTEP